MLPRYYLSKCLFMLSKCVKKTITPMKYFIDHTAFHQKYLPIQYSFAVVAAIALSLKV